MEERLDDAINVLRNHAESVVGGPQSALAGTGPAPALSHSNGIMAAYPPVLEPLMVWNQFIPPKKNIAFMSTEHFEERIVTFSFLGWAPSGQQYSRSRTSIVLRQFRSSLTRWPSPWSDGSVNGWRSVDDRQGPTNQFKYVLNLKCFYFILNHQN